MTPHRPDNNVRIIFLRHSVSSVADHQSFPPSGFLVRFEVDCRFTTCGSFIGGDFFGSGLNNVAGLYNVPEDFVELADVGLALEVLAEFSDWDQRVLSITNEIPDAIGKVSLFHILNSMFADAAAKLFCAPLDDFNSPFPIFQRWSRFPGQNGGLAKVVSGFDYAASFSCSLSIA